MIATRITRRQLHSVVSRSAVVSATAPAAKAIKCAPLSQNAGAILLMSCPLMLDSTQIVTTHVMTANQLAATRNVARFKGSF